MGKYGPKFLNDVQIWSEGMDSLFHEEIYQVIMDDDRTTKTDNNDDNRLLGYPFDIIRNEVVGKGLANFSEPYENGKYSRLLPDDRVLLYCYLNLRRHFYSSWACFKLQKNKIRREFVKRDPVMIDVGCGPATSALALSELYPGSPFTYVGVDSAPAMLKCGEALLEAARKRGVVAEETEWHFLPSWESRGERIPAGSTVMFNFSYFFASNTLERDDLQSLADTIKRVAGHRSSRKVFVSYTNSTLRIANEKYNEFLGILGVTPLSCRKRRTIRFRNRRRYGKEHEKKEEFFRELWEF